MKKPYRHVIWDWNGTLWDDTWLCTEINNHMLQRRNLPAITIDIYRESLCFPVSDYYCQLGFEYAQTSYNMLAEEFIAEYEQRRFECVLQDGGRELIEHLHGQGVPQAVLSAYQHDTLLQAVEYFQLTPYFDDIIGLNDVYAAGKVENGIKYMARQETAPDQILFIGDTLHDFEVAQAMGVNCILVCNGHNSRPRLEACGVPVFDSLHEVRNHIDEILG